MKVGTGDTPDEALTEVINYPDLRQAKESFRITDLSCFHQIINMANSAQARKRARQTAKQRVHNMDQRSSLRTAIKKVRKAIDAGDKVAAQTVFIESQKIIDSIADKKIVHKNLAARQKSRLSAAIKAL